MYAYNILNFFIIKSKMICSLCLSKSTDCKLFFILDIQIPCSHNICLSCAPKPKSILSNSVKYQCQTCLAYHDIKITSNQSVRNQNNSNKNIRNVMYQNSQIYCWSCSQAIEMEQYLQGRHQGHNVTTLGEATPAIKNKLMNKLSTGLTLLQHLERQRQLLSHNDLFSQYSDQLERIELFFQEQAALMSRKRANILEQMQLQYSRCSQSVSRQLSRLQSIIEQTSKANNLIKQYLSDRITIHQLTQTIDMHQQISNIRRRIYRLPNMAIFIERSSIQTAVELSCCISPSKIDQQDMISISINSNTNKNYNSSTNKYNSNTNKCNIFNNNNNSNKKVNLVQRLKNRFMMKSNDSLAGTGITY